MKLSHVGGVLLIASGFLVACSGENAPPPPSPTASQPAKPAAVLDGVYAAAFQRGEQVSNGRPNPQETRLSRFAFRSACNGDACVATGIQIKGKDPQAVGTGSTPFVLDFVDGAWIGVLRPAKMCKDQQIAIVESWTIKPQPDGTLTGTSVEAYFDNSCSGANLNPVTLTRTGDVDPSITLADAAQEPPLTPSAGAGFRGRYEKTLSRNGSVEFTSMETVTTTCVRNTEECLTYHAADGGAGALELADGRWTNVAEFMSKCTDGSPALYNQRVEIAMPQPPANPFPRLTGTQVDVPGEPCPGKTEAELVITRIGD